MISAAIDGPARDGHTLSSKSAPNVAPAAMSPTRSVQFFWHGGAGRVLPVRFDDDA